MFSSSMLNFASGHNGSCFSTGGLLTSGVNINNQIPTGKRQREMALIQKTDGKAFCCLQRGDWVERQLLDEANPDDPSQQFHSRGLDSSTVYSLPIAQFKKNEGPSHSNTDCAVCLGEFEEGEFLKHLPNCSHVFHIPCIDTWFESHSNCPLCRTHVYDFTMDNEFSGSMYTLLETLRREDFFQEWVENYQILRVEILQTSTHRQEPENGT
ncbi:RING-H2 finger protein ATL16 [Vitis vinifera]|uniref:RING-type E3 ubiquitin transferase n=1 Tax=Vitis vinifera TaxID=29760 RepID=A0A438FAK2_VITVI|nr:RING-H2 finger protein ATL16 [Vitis vinifera]